MALLTRAAAAAAALAWLLACGPDGGPGRYPATGVVEGVQTEQGQVLIAHDEIEGLMPAMTMNFEVDDPAVLEVLRPGQQIAFTLEFTGRSYKVVEVEVRGEVEPDESWVRFGEGLVRSMPAPPFALTDQAGRPFALADLEGKAVLLDFIFTHCPGPCPILTGIQASAQEKIPTELRERVHFVSISLDPLRDTPEALTAYARARGAELDNWSFLTGPVEDVEPVLKAYGIGTTRSPEGEIEHVVATFLISVEGGKGRIVKRYLGLQHEPEELARELVELAS